MSRFYPRVHCLESMFLLLSIARSPTVSSGLRIKFTKKWVQMRAKKTDNCFRVPCQYWLQFWQGKTGRASSFASNNTTCKPEFAHFLPSSWFEDGSLELDALTWLKNSAKRPNRLRSYPFLSCDSREGYHETYALLHEGGCEKFSPQTTYEAYFSIS